MEHVLHVASVSGTIANYLGLDRDLTRAISIGHDIGHTPFGHAGEKILEELSRYWLDGSDFWHEMNGLRFADKIELLEDFNSNVDNLGLTYAVRDGIVCHCGEVDDYAIFPREHLGDPDFDGGPNATGDPFGDLYSISRPEQDVSVNAVTWEGCIVKIADKIAYLGRDIEDAIELGFLGPDEIADLKTMARKYDENAMNTTVIMHNMIVDLCEHSSPDEGIRLSGKYREQMKELMMFNYSHIYLDKRLDPYSKYARLALEQIFERLHDYYDGEETIANLHGSIHEYPLLIREFISFLRIYSAVDSPLRYRNVKIYGTLDSEEIYDQAIIDFIAGMTDRFAVKVYEELLKY
jgi:dGTPase